MKPDHVPKTYRTHQIRKGHRLHAYFQEMTEKSKNLYNATNFYIRQIYTALKNEGTLHPLQQEVITTLATALPLMNERQMNAFEKKQQRERQKPLQDQQVIKPILFTLPTADNAFVSYSFLDCLFKQIQQPDYKALPAHSAQGVMKDVQDNWLSFFKSLKDYKKHPSKYNGKPRIPKYKQTLVKDVVFSSQSCVIKEGKYLKFPATKSVLNIGKLGLGSGRLKEVRAIPRHGEVTVELVMEQIDPVPPPKANGRWMGVDLGLDNLAAAVTNTGRRPVLIKGTAAKAVNQFYNKKKGSYISLLRQGKQPGEGAYTSKRLEKLHQRRSFKLKDLFHKASNLLVQAALEDDISVLYIGYNKGWKQELAIGKKNTQSFTSISHDLFVQMLSYKAAAHGIQVVRIEESYTSKASFADEDALPIYGQEIEMPVFSGKRIKRGLYRTKAGQLINADVNGAANILAKAAGPALNRQTVNLLQPDTRRIP